MGVRPTAPGHGRFYGPEAGGSTALGWAVLRPLTGRFYGPGGGRFYGPGTGGSTALGQGGSTALGRAVLRPWGGRFYGPASGALRFYGSAALCVLWPRLALHKKKIVQA